MLNKEYDHKYISINVIIVSCNLNWYIKIDRYIWRNVYIGIMFTIFFFMVAFTELSRKSNKKKIRLKSNIPSLNTKSILIKLFFFLPQQISVKPF